MSYTYHGATGLIKLPGKTITTFTDNEQRVDIQYACRKTYVDTAIGLLKKNAEVPGESGFVIEFDPQVTIRDDGFANIVVSGYRRKNDVVSSTTDPYQLSLALNLSNFTYFPALQGILQSTSHPIVLNTQSVTQTWLYKIVAYDANGVPVTNGSSTQPLPSQKYEDYYFDFTPLYETSFLAQFPTFFEIQFSGSEWTEIARSSNGSSYIKDGLEYFDYRIVRQAISVPTTIYITIQQNKYRFTKQPFKSYQTSFDPDSIGGFLGRRGPSWTQILTGWQYKLTP
jgi:hypothetical protein